MIVSKDQNFPVTVHEVSQHTVKPPSSPKKHISLCKFESPPSSPDKTMVEFGRCNQDQSPKLLDHPTYV